jgi:hypothetical protein
MKFFIMWNFLLHYVYHCNYCIKDLEGQRVHLDMTLKRIILTGGGNITLDIHLLTKHFTD